MDSTLKVVKSSIQLRFASADGQLDAIRDQARAGEILHLNHHASRPEAIVLQTPTSSTVAEVRPGTAVMVTTYFGQDYMTPSRGGDREDYARGRLDALLQTLSTAVGTFELIAAGVEARISVNDIPMAQLHRAATTAFGLTGVLTEGADCFDFDVRVSRVVAPDLFSNIKVGWYQTRTAQMVVGQTQPGEPLPAGARSSISEWQMSLTDQGLTVKYDRNNKHGLFQGKGDWSADDVRRVYLGALKEFPSALAGVERQLEPHLSNGGTR